MAAAGPARRRGLIPRAAGRALLVRGSLVHGIGMEELIGLVGIDAGGRVLSARVLEPGRIALLRGASWVLELPADEPIPAVGARLRMGPAS